MIVRDLTPSEWQKEITRQVISAFQSGALASVGRGLLPSKRDCFIKHVVEGALVAYTCSIEYDPGDSRVLSIELNDSLKKAGRVTCDRGAASPKRSRRGHPKCHVLRILALDIGRAFQRHGLATTLTASPDPAGAINPYSDWITVTYKVASIVDAELQRVLGKPPTNSSRGGMVDVSADGAYRVRRLAAGPSAAKQACRVARSIKNY